MSEAVQLRPCLVRAVVLGTEAVTPCIRRIVFGGPELARFADPCGALGPYLKLLVPTGPDCDWPELDTIGRPRWRPGARRPAVRTYSVRRFDPVRSELQVDVVLHGDEGAGSRWAGRARAGDAIGLVGPACIPAPPPRHSILAGDHTALPAIAYTLETLPAGACAHVAVEIPAEAERQPMPSRAATEVTWLVRPPGAPSRLVERLASMLAEADDPLVWAGAEAATARAIRTQLRAFGPRAVAKSQVLNYWKAGQPEGGFSYVD